MKKLYEFSETKYLAVIRVFRKYRKHFELIGLSKKLSYEFSIFVKQC